MTPWTWGAETYPTRDEAEAAIAAYAKSEIENRKLDTVVAPDGTPYAIQVVAIVVPRAVLR